MTVLVNGIQEINNQQIYCKVWGNIDNKQCDGLDSLRGIIVFSHGFGEHIDYYDDLAQYFTRKSFVCIGQDYPYHGRSDGEMGALTQFSRLPDVLIARCIGARSAFTSCHPPVFILSHSMGGLVALHAIAKHAESENASVPLCDGLITIGPLWNRFPSAGFPPGFATIVSWLPSVSLTIASSAVDAAKLSHDEALCEKYRVDPLVYHGPATLRLVQAMLAAMKHADAIADRIALPKGALVVFGANDEVCSESGARTTFAKMTNVEDKSFVVVADSKHQVHNETAVAKKICYETISDWLDERSPPSQPIPDGDES